MAILLPSEMITEVRRDCVDLDSTDPAVSDAIILSKLNKYYLLWHEKVGRKTTFLTTTDGGVTLSAGNTTGVTGITSIIDILRVHRVADAVTAMGTPLEIRPFSDVVRLQVADATQGTPTIAGFTRTASGNVTSIGKWVGAFHPIPNGTFYMALHCRIWPIIVTAAATSPMDVTELGAYTICKLAASEVAAMIGEDDAFIANILRDVPDEISALMGIARPGYRKPHADDRTA